MDRDDLNYKLIGAIALCGMIWFFAVVRGAAVTDVKEKPVARAVAVEQITPWHAAGF
jgi:hypothetical protein